ncbi:hypothetical protein D3C87_1540010 [compost metagenome]
MFQAIVYESGHCLFRFLAESFVHHIGVEVSQLDRGFRIFTILVYDDVTPVFEGDGLNHFLAVGGRDVIRVENRILTQFRDDIRARIIAPPLMERIHADFAGYDIGVHRCCIFNPKIRIDNSHLVPFRPCRECFLHLGLDRTVDDLTVFVFNPYIRMSSPCHCEKFECFERLINRYTITSVFFHELQRDVFNVIHRLRIRKPKFFLPVIADPDKIGLVNDAVVQLRNTV